MAIQHGKMAKIKYLSDVFVDADTLHVDEKAPDSR